MCLSLSFRLSPSLLLSLSLSLSLSISLSLSFSISILVSLSVSVSLSVCLCLCLCPYLPLLCRTALGEELVDREVVLVDLIPGRGRCGHYDRQPTAIFRKSRYKTERGELE